MTMALSLLSGFLSVRFFGREIFDGASGMVQQLFSGLSSRSAGLSVERVGEVLTFSGGCFLLAVVPTAVLASSMSVASSLLQGGLAFHGLQLAPDFSRMSPLSGIRRWCHARSLARGLFAVTKCIAVVWIAWGIGVEVAAHSVGTYFVGSLEESGHGSCQTVWAACFRLLCRFGLQSSLALVGLGAMEYLFQRWQHERDLRMSPAEIREELVRLEGSAEWKSKRQKFGQEILRRGASPAVKGVSLP